MSDILIRGMELPEDKEICLRIDKKGEVYVYGSYPTELYKAVPVPEHGRLIDADALMKRMWEETDCMISVPATFVRDAPTIIPADDPKEE